MFCIVEGNRIPCSLDGRLHIYRTEEEAEKSLNETTLCHNKNFTIAPYDKSFVFGKQSAYDWIMKSYAPETSESPNDDSEGPKENPKLKNKLAKNIYAPKGLLPNGKPRQRKPRSDKGKSRAK